MAIAITIWKKQMDINYTLPELTSGRPILLLIDNDPLKLELLHQIFHDDHEVFCAASGVEALAFCQTLQPDLILLDTQLTEMDSFEVCRRLKDAPLTREIPVIFITAYHDPFEEEQGLAAGAVDFISHTTSHNVMRARVKTHLSLKQHAELLRTLNLVDDLTGIANRRHFDQALDSEWRRCVRGARPVTVILIEIDFFQAFSDHYGQQAAERSLRQVAQCLKAGLNRSPDLTARYDGDKFVCLLPETPLEGALIKAEAQRQAILKLTIPHQQSMLANGMISISLGVAVMIPLNGIEEHMLVEAAERALDEAKQAGGNQVSVIPL